MFKSKENNDNIGPSKGFMKWVNRFFRFILYPFIHPKIFLCLILMIVAAVLIPLFVYKVEFSDLPKWYHDLFNQAYEMIAPIKEKAVQKYKEYKNPNFQFDETNNKKSEDMIEYETVRQTHRSTFQIDETIDDNQLEIPTQQVISDEEPIETNNDLEVSNQDEIIQATTDKLATPQDTIKIYFKRNDKLNLNYLNTPEEISGRLAVINANEALINSTSIFLYGIYTPPQKNRQAAHYMLTTYDGKQVKCYIGAYTSDNHATAICYYGDISINHDLINKGYAQNISLY